MTPFRIAALMTALVLTAAPAPAAEPGDAALFQEAGELTLDAFRWDKRPVVIFADSALDPLFTRQMQALQARPEALAIRDVVIITDTDPAAMSPLRRLLRPRGFMLVLVGKDGQIKLRKPQPWDVRELSRSIDKMPIRQQELQSQRNTVTTP